MNNDNFKDFIKKDKDDLIYLYFEQNILEGKFNLLLGTFPFFKSKKSFIDLWKLIYETNCHQKNKKEQTINLIITSKTKNYIEYYFVMHNTFVQVRPF